MHWIDHWAKVPKYYEKFSLKFVINPKSNYNIGQYWSFNNDRGSHRGLQLFASVDQDYCLMGSSLIVWFQSTDKMDREISKSSFKDGKLGMGFSLAV